VTGAMRPAPAGIEAGTVAAWAAERSAIASALDRENEIDRVAIDEPGQPPVTEAGQKLLREVRAAFAADFRHRAAGDAVVAFYQLADAEGRGEIVRSSIVSLDKLRAAIKDAIAKGVKPPIDEDELDRQRATYIGLLGQVELGATLLEGDLRRRIDFLGLKESRLQPTGDFSVPSTGFDTDALVKQALESRQELVALRTLYHGLTVENLPEVRDLLGSQPGLGGISRGTVPLLLRNRYDRIRAAAKAQVDAVLATEVERRKQQLFALIGEKERAAADEVRAQVAILREQSNQIGLARWRSEKLKAKLDELKKDDKGAATIVPAELEWNRARADVIQAVMAWHQARARLTTAIGVR